MNATETTLTIVFGVLYWIASAVSVAVIANRCNRDAGAFFALSLIFTPVVGLLALIAVNTREKPDPPLPRLKPVKDEGAAER